MHIPGNVRFIGCEAFYQCKNLMKLSFSKEISRIEVEEAAFAGHFGLFWKENDEGLGIPKNAYIVNASLDKFGFWD